MLVKLHGDEDLPAEACDRSQGWMTSSVLAYPLSLNGVVLEGGRVRVARTAGVRCSGR